MWRLQEPGVQLTIEQVTAQGVVYRQYRVDINLAAVEEKVHRQGGDVLDMVEVLIPLAAICEGFAYRSIPRAITSFI